MSDVCWLVPPGRLSPRCEPCLVRAGVTSGGDMGAQVAATRETESGQQEEFRK